MSVIESVTLAARQFPGRKKAFVHVYIYQNELRLDFRCFTRKNRPSVRGFSIRWEDIPALYEILAWAVPIMRMYAENGVDPPLHIAESVDLSHLVKPDAKKPFLIKKCKPVIPENESGSDG